MACAIQRKYNRVHNNNTTAVSVNGAKELKKYVTEMTTLLANIQSEFEADMVNVNASSKVNQMNHREFRNEMCRVAHNNFIYAATKLPQCSAFLQAKEAAEECLSRIELVRKMMVTNKQQKKTAVRNLRTLIAHEKKARMMLPALVIDKNPAIITQHLMKSVALEEDEPCSTVKGLRDMITQTKQNHRTVGKNLLKQAAALMEAMRDQHILTYKTAAESTIGAIMNHASACSAFMRQTLHLAVIKFCASRWWNEFEKPASSASSASSQSNTNYYVNVELASGLDAKFDVSHCSHYLSFLEEGCPMPDIRVVVYKDPVLNPITNEYEKQVHCSYVFDDLLAETILTDEAFEAFEEANK